MRMPEGWPEPGPFVGREAVMRQFEQHRETWDADSFEPISDFIDVGDRVVVRFIWHGAGHGPESNMEATGVYTVRKGRIVVIEHFWDHAEALKPLGFRSRRCRRRTSSWCAAVRVRTGATATPRPFRSSHPDAVLDLSRKSSILACTASMASGASSSRRRMWEGFQIELEELIDGGDQVARPSGYRDEEGQRGRGRYAVVHRWTLREGRCRG